MKLTLYPELLAQAYSIGFFPMPDPDAGEIVFLRPDPRAIIPLDGFHTSQSLKRAIRKGSFLVSYDQAFREVMKGCADRNDTWITKEFMAAYHVLFRRGQAHSVEIWKNSALVGGVYGVAIGGAFFAESKFHRVSNASKVALYYLVQYLRWAGFTLLEVQFLTPHLASLGAIEIPDTKYQTLLTRALRKKTKRESSTFWSSIPGHCNCKSP